MTDINDYLESLKTKLEEVIVEFQAKYNSLPQLEIDLLANINTVLGASSSSSGGLTPAEAKIATKEAIQEASNLDQIETKLDALANQTTLSNILTQLQTDLGVLKTNTSKISQYQIQLAEDATNTVFIVRFDSISGSTANFTLSGASYSPVAPIQIVSDGSNLEVQTNEFEAITANPGNWAIGDILTRISIVNTSTSAVANIWQSALGTTLSTIPIIGTDVIDSDRKILELLRSVLANLITETNIKTAIESATNLDELETKLNGLASQVDTTISELQAIKNNTGRISQYQIQLAEDSTNTVFIVRFDSITGITANFTLGGAIYTPIPPIQIVPDGSNLEVQINEFEAITNNSGNWAIGNILSRILIVNTSNNSTSAIWQSASGTTLNVIPIIGTDVIDTDKQALTVLRSLSSTLGLTTDQVASDDIGDYSFLSLFKRFLSTNTYYLSGWTAIASYPVLTNVVSSNVAPPSSSFISIPSAANGKCREIEIFPDFEEVKNAPNSLLVAIWALPTYDTRPFLVGLIGYSAGENRANILTNAYGALGTTFIDLKQDLSQLKLYAQVLADPGTISVIYDFSAKAFVAVNNGLSTTIATKCEITSNDIVPDGLGVDFGIRQPRHGETVNEAFTTDYVNSVTIASTFANWDEIILNTNLLSTASEYLPHEGICGRCYSADIDTNTNEIAIENCGFDLTKEEFQRVRFRNASASLLSGFLNTASISNTTTYYLINVRKTGTGLATKYFAQISLNGATPLNIVAKPINTNYFYLFPVGKFSVYVSGENLYSSTSFTAENLITRRYNTLFYNPASANNNWSSSGGSASTFTLNNSFGTTTPVEVFVTANTMPTGLVYGQRMFTVPSATTSTSTQLSYTSGGRPVACTAAGSGVRLTRVDGSGNNLSVSSVTVGTATTFTLNTAVTATERALFLNNNTRISVYNTNTSTLPSIWGYVVSTSGQSFTMSEIEGGAGLVIGNASGYAVSQFIAASLSPYQRKYVKVLSDANDENKLIYLNTANNPITLKNTAGNNLFILSPSDEVQIKGKIKVRGVNF